MTVSVRIIVDTPNTTVEIEERVDSGPPKVKAWDGAKVEFVSRDDETAQALRRAIDRARNAYPGAY